MTNTELLQALYDDMQTVKENVSSLDRRVSSLEKDIAKIPSLEKKINEISLTLENETNRNIKIIAEGHLDLSRKLNESIKLSSEVKAEQELHSIYINAFNRQLKVF